MASLIKSAMVARGAQALLCVKSVAVMQRSDIMGKAMRGNIERPPKPKPFDYENKFYSFWTYISDTTSNRFDENMAMIVVDGPIGVGKDKFAKELAEELDMKYYPEPNMDYYYINDYGYNMSWTIRMSHYFDDIEEQPAASKLKSVAGLVIIKSKDYNTEMEQVDQFTHLDNWIH